MNERMKLILKTTDSSVFRDLRIKNVGISSCEHYWDVSEKNIKVMQATATDDRRHCNPTADGSVVVSLGLTISARDPYEKKK